MTDKLTKSKKRTKSRRTLRKRDIPTQQIVSFPSSKIQGSRAPHMKNGWICVKIEGDPFPRGFAHGYLLALELKRVKKVFPFILKKYYHIPFKTYLSYCAKHITPKIQEYSLEMYEELCGIVAGATTKGIDIDLDFLVGWNSYLSLYSYHKANGSKHPLERCSAFIACGSATEKGDVVMAHNTHTDFVTGQLCNIILDIRPTNGHCFRMQISPGNIASGTDWFMCENGIIGCETTIGGFIHAPKFGVPYFCRIRKAIQYGETLDEYAAIMKDGNAGDYPCSWLLGDTKKKEIMMIELGLTVVKVHKKTDGVFYGMNSAISPELREKETDDKDFLDTHTASGARNVRLHFLLYETYYGKINLGNARKIIGDHYDVLLGKDVRNSMGICKHMENDSTEYFPFGCTDGKVINSEMAKDMSFWGILGSACGRSFSVHDFVKKHPQFKSWKDYMHDFPHLPWTKL